MGIPTEALRENVGIPHGKRNLETSEGSALDGGKEFSGGIEPRTYKNPFVELMKNSVIDEKISRVNRNISARGGFIPIEFNGVAFKSPAL